MNRSVAHPRWRIARNLLVNERTKHRSYPSVPSTCEHQVVSGSGDHHDRHFAILLFVSLSCCLCTTGPKSWNSAPAPNVPTRPPCKGLRHPRCRNGNARQALPGPKQLIRTGSNSRPASWWSCPRITHPDHGSDSPGHRIGSDPGRDRQAGGNALRPSIVTRTALPSRSPGAALEVSSGPGGARDRSIVPGERLRPVNPSREARSIGPRCGAHHSLEPRGEIGLRRKPAQIGDFGERRLSFRDHQLPPFRSGGSRGNCAAPSRSPP